MRRRRARSLKSLFVRNLLVVLAIMAWATTASGLGTLLAGAAGTGSEQGWYFTTVSK